MDEIGGLYQLIVRAGDYTFHFNLTTIVMTWIVIGLLLFFGYMATRQRATFCPTTFRLWGRSSSASFIH